MNDHILRIATRRSALALWQAEHVRELLCRYHPGLEVTLVPLSTRGDRILDKPLAKVGGKGLFIKELERAMADGEADIAVHSMKDVPAVFPAGFELAVILASGDPCDALVSNHYDELAALPEGARVGTSSLRRQSQLLAQRPDLQVGFLRGNVQTRLDKLDRGDFDAIVLAAAGLQRLGLATRIARRLPPEVLLPAVGQGAIGVECRAGDARVRDLLAPLADAATTWRLTAERAMNARLQGSCEVPIGGHAVLDGEHLWLRGLVASVDGATLVTGETRGPLASAAMLGEALAEDLLARGAREILAELGGSAEA